MSAAAIDPLPVIRLSPDQLPELQIAALDAAAVDPLPVIQLSWISSERDRSRRSVWPFLAPQSADKFNYAKVLTRH